jgi:hypothetical protein
VNLVEYIVDVLLETTEVSPEDVIRRSQLGVQPEDFVLDGNPDRCGGYQTGNYHYAVYYKPIKVRGKPIYLGRVLAAHAYNDTGSTSHVNFYISSVPSWTTMHTGLKRGVNRLSPFKGGAKTRTHYGHRGVMTMDKAQYQSFDSLFDAAKYLLSLVRPNSRIEPNFEHLPVT